MTVNTRAVPLRKMERVIKISIWHIVCVCVVIQMCVLFWNIPYMNIQAAALEANCFSEIEVVKQSLPWSSSTAR